MEKDLHLKFADKTHWLHHVDSLAQSQTIQHPPALAAKGFISLKTQITELHAGTLS